MQDSMMEYGLVGACLIILWKAVQIIGAMVRSRLLPATPLSAPVAEKIDQLAQWADEKDDEINRGQFSCAWQGRDEVRDFGAAIADLTLEVKLLRKELEKVNGNLRR